MAVTFLLRFMTAYWVELGPLIALWVGARGVFLKECFLHPLRLGYDGSFYEHSIASL